MNTVYSNYEQIIYINYEKHAWLLTKKLYDVTSGNDKLIHVPVPSFAKLATFIYGFL
jgi:hypothetical protein